MVLGMVVPQIVPQMMQFKQFHQYQIDMNAFGNGNLSSIHLVFRHLIDFLAVQHQVRCKSVWFIKTDLLVCNRQRYAILVGEEFSCLEFDMNRDTISWIWRKNRIQEVAYGTLTEENLSKRHQLYAGR